MNENCEIFSYMINDYLDGALNKEDSKDLKQHLRQCKDCNDKLKELKKTIDMVASLKTIKIPEVPNTFSQDIIGKLEEETTAFKVLPMFFNKYAVASIIAMVVVGLMVVMMFSKNNPNLVENPIKPNPGYEETIITDEYEEDFYIDKSIIAEYGLPTDNWGLLNLDGM